MKIGKNKKFFIKNFYKYTNFVIKNFYKYIIILFLINILFFFFYYKYKRFNFNTRYIFTFWEPRNTLPGYLRLCLMTWKIYLPEYKIILLDYESLPYYLDSNTISKITCKKMTLSVQTDAIRIALLEKYGGIWMDIDTIITNNKILNIFNGFDLAMLGFPKYKTQHIAFIYATKYSIYIKKWLKCIIEKIKIFKNILIMKQNNITEIINEEWKKVIRWSYLGNSIIDPLLKNVTGKDFLRVDILKINSFPEHILKRNINSPIFRYINLYFNKGNARLILKLSKGIICLHNSWTPFKYKKMSQKLFLEQDIMLSHLFRLLLTKNNINK